MFWVCAVGKIQAIKDNANTGETLKTHFLSVHLSAGIIPLSLKVILKSKGYKLLFFRRKQMTTPAQLLQNFVQAVERLYKRNYALGNNVRFTLLD
jgi:hypothetical protein